MYRLAQLFDEAASPEDYAKRYLARLAEVLQTLDTAAIARIIDVMDPATRNGKTLYLLANGGSEIGRAHV